MDLPQRNHVVLILLFMEYLNSLVSGTNWEHISLRYGTWYTPPRTPQEAERSGYRLVNKICKMDTYHGFLYIKGGNNKSRLLFDLNGNLAGIQTAIPGNMYGYNALNESIKVPSDDIIPPILLSDDRDAQGVQMYTITAYFKHPRLICSPFAINAHPGKGLYIQTGYSVEHQFEKISMEDRHLSTDWKKGGCRPQMGVHYFKNLSHELPCEKLYPVFLMYNQDGLLGAFGWLFQGSPAYYPYDEDLSWFKLSQAVYPYIFDEKMLPNCMFNPEFRVFGLRIYLRNKEAMICNSPTPSPTTPFFLFLNTTTAKAQATRPIFHDTPIKPITPNPPSYDDTIILDDVIREQENSGGEELARTLWTSYVNICCAALCLLGLQAMVVRFCLQGLFVSFVKT